MPMQLCRICGGTINLIPILAVDTELHEKLLVCANIRIATSDSLPRYICGKCEQSLDLSYRLRKQSEATEQRLRLKLKEEQNQEEIQTQYMHEEIKEEFIDISEQKHVVNSVSEAYQYMDGVGGNNNNIEELETDVKVSVADASFISSQQEYVVEKKESETVDVCREAEASKGENDCGNEVGVAKRSSCSYVVNGAIDVHFRVEERMFKCSFCSKTFPTLLGVNRHAAVTHNITPNNDHKCSQCDRSYNRRSSLIRHIRSAHNEVADSADVFQENSVDYIHKCNTCLRRFGTLHDLNTHEEIHISNLINKFSRPSTSSSYSSEITRSHEKIYYCGYCGKESNNSFEHKCHLKTHVKDKIYSCTVCQKKFHTMASLLTHEWVHVKNYVCDMCNRGFCEMKDLKQHKLVHENAAPYMCHICLRSYVKEYNLKMHLKREHKDALPFRCALCPAGFSAMSNLKVHARQIHGRSILHNVNAANENEIEKLESNSGDDKNSSSSTEVASESLEYDATHTDSILLSDTSNSATELATETLEYHNYDNLVVGTPESMQHMIPPQALVSPSPTNASRNNLDSIIIESSSDTDVASETLEIEYKQKIQNTKYSMLIEPDSPPDTIQNNLAEIIIESSNSSVIDITKEMDKEPRKITKSRIKGRKGRRNKFRKGYKIKDS